MKKIYKPGFYFELSEEGFGDIWLFTGNNECWWLGGIDYEWFRSINCPNGYLDSVELEFIGN